MTAVPHHRDVVQEMLAYDLVGFQTIEARQNFEDPVARQYQRLSRPESRA
jgi:trehalose-6-phosphate synthase